MALTIIKAWRNRTRCSPMGGGQLGYSKSPIVQAASTATAALTYSQQVLADSPLLYWRLGEASGLTAADASGNGRTGTYTGSGITYSATGAVTGDNAITTDGSAGCVQSTAALDLSAFSVVTVEIWANVPAFANNDKMLMELGTGSGADGNFWINLNDSSGSASLVFFGNTNNIVRFTRPSTGSYHHFVVKYRVATTNGALTCRLDKVDLSMTQTSANAVTAFASAAKLNVGARNGGASLQFAATIDEVAVYGSDLSTARTDAHYDAKLV